MQYFQITLETPGEFADDAVLDSSSGKTVVERASFTIAAKSLSDLMEIHPVAIVSNRLMERFKNEKVSGVTFGRVYLSKNGRDISGYSLMTISGEMLNDDFFIGTNNMTVINERIRGILSEYDLGSHEVRQYAHGRTPKEELQIQMQEMKDRMAAKYPKRSVLP
jgi:hypothetical protein